MQNLRNLRKLANYLDKHYELNNILPSEEMFESVGRDLGIDPSELVLMLNELSITGTAKLHSRY
jgi:hypothetical protein